MFKTDNLKKIQKRAIKHLKRGNIIKAKEEYLKGLAIDPTNISILNNLAQIYRMLNRKDKTRGYLEKLIEECEKNSYEDEQVLIMKLFAQTELERIEDSNETLDRLIELYPNNTLGLYHKSLLLEKNNEPEQALGYLKKILKIDEYNIAALLAKGRNLVEIKEYNKAEECYNLVFKIEPKNKAAMNLKGKLLKKKKNQENSICAHDLMLKAVEFWEMEDFKKADNFLKKALDMDPSFDEIWYCRGELLIRMGRINDAIASFNKAFEINPESGGIVNKKEFYRMLNIMKRINTLLGYEK